MAVGHTQFPDAPISDFARVGAHQLVTKFFLGEIKLLYIYCVCIYINMYIVDQWRTQDFLSGFWTPLIPNQVFAIPLVQDV